MKTNNWNYLMRQIFEIEKSGKYQVVRLGNYCKILELGNYDKMLVEQIGKDPFDAVNQCVIWFYHNAFVLREKVVFGVDREKIKEAIQDLEMAGYFFPSMWTIYDIKQRALDRFKVKLGIQKLRKIASDCKLKHDCEIGFNWDVMDFHVENNL